jgi:hypothetical protein
VAVTRFEVRSRSALAGYPYERLDGRLHVAVDPADPANRAIVDLDRAARDVDGKVHFWSDLVLLRPTGQGNRRLLVDVVNRGRRTLLRAFNRAAGEAQPGPDIDPGDGFLLRRGWTLAFLGWQWDVVRSDVLLGLEAPQALDDDGKPIRGQVVVQFQPNEAERDHLLADRVHLPYPAADVDEPGASMTVRDWQDGERHPIPRERWWFARDEGGRPVADAARVWLEGGFEAGRVYEVLYRTRVCPVVGTGILRHGTDGNPSAGALDHAFVYGVSQSGRFLRTFLYAGMNVDEAGRQVYDGVLPHVAGARRGEFNHRFAQPSVQHTRSFGHLPPFHGDELLRRQREVGGVPRVISTNSSAEYWRGDCSLIHTTPDGARDLDPPAEERIYHFAGTQHGAGALPFASHNPNDGARGVHSFNVVDYSPLLRAALENLDRWATEGIEPPSSVFPRLADGTAGTMAEAVRAVGELPGATGPDVALLPRMASADLGPETANGIARYPAPVGAPYRTYVAAVDADRNELSGIRLPDLTVPLATFAGWNPRHPATGGAGQIIPMSGSTLPFRATRAEREAAGDPRASIEERYRDRSDYLARVRSEAERLAAQHYVLAEDVDLIVANAAERWQAMARAPAAVGAG